MESFRAQLLAQIILIAHGITLLEAWSKANPENDLPQYKTRLWALKRAFSLLTLDARMIAEKEASQMPLILGGPDHPPEAVYRATSAAVALLEFFSPYLLDSKTKEQLTT